MKFWQVQENELVKMGVTQKYSEEFKDLIQKMLAYEPTERLTIEGIKSHAWYNGEVAPLICLVSELEDKLKVVQETHEAKELEKQKVKDLKRQIKALSQASNQTGGLGNFVGYRPFRSGGDETGEQEKVNKEAEGAIDFSLKRKFASFNLETLPKARTQIFITSDVKSVFVSLYLACKQELNDFSVSKSNYKIKGRVVKDKGSCNLEIIVSRVEEGSLCVEFFKLNGDMILFYKVIDKMKSRLPIAPEEKTTETKTENA